MVIAGRDFIRLLRQIDVERASGVSDATYYGWWKKFGGMGPSNARRMKELERENQRLRKVVSDLTLDKLILKENFDYFEPRA